MKSFIFFITHLLLSSGNHFLLPNSHFLHMKVFFRATKFLKQIMLNQNVEKTIAIYFFGQGAKQE